MGIHGMSNSSTVRNIYESRHKITKRRKKQKNQEKAKIKYGAIYTTEDVDELATGVQFRNKRWKVGASAVPISGKRRRKLLKNAKREIREEVEDLKKKEALEVVEMEDEEQTKPKKKKKLKKKAAANDDEVTPMITD